MTGSKTSNIVTVNDIEIALHGSNPTLIWGMTSAERGRRLVAKLGQKVAGSLWINTDFAFDPQWMRFVVERPGMLLALGGVPILAHIPEGGETTELAALKIPAEFKVVEYQDDPQIHNYELRKLDTPFVRILTPDTVRDIERQSYFGAYKGITDILTKYLWPELALVITRYAARLKMTPNMITAIGAINCIAATIFFYYGYFWSGMLTGFVFMVLDTVDGKLARCTITSSYWGNIFDHGIDLVHPPFWWVAWAFGLAAAGMALPPDQLTIALGLILGGYVFQRVLEGAFILFFSQHMHVWRPFDSWFRLITARRNPNMVLLFVALLFGRPDLGLLAVAWWTGLSLLVHMAQLLQATWIKMRGGEITSWLEQNEEVKA